MTALAPAIIAASVALIVAILNPSVTSQRARRQAVSDRFDNAQSALLLVQAARWVSTGMSEIPQGWTEEEHREFTMRMHQRAIELYADRTSEAKAALAAIAAHVPEARAQITGDWELKEADEPALRAAIENRRKGAIKSERLFRVRRAIG